MAAGLAFLHAAGVLHLDVKPGNVFVDAAGGLRLGDFGLAVLRHQWVRWLSVLARASSRTSTLRIKSTCAPPAVCTSATSGWQCYATSGCGPCCSLLPNPPSHVFRQLSPN